MLRTHFERAGGGSSADTKGQKRGQKAHVQKGNAITGKASLVHQIGVFRRHTGRGTVYVFQVYGLTLLAYLNYTPRIPCQSTES